MPATDSEHPAGREGSRLVAATSLVTAHSLPSAGCIMRAVGDNTSAAKRTVGILVAKRVVPRRGNALIPHATISWLTLRSRKRHGDVWINPSRSLIMRFDIVIYDLSEKRTKNYNL